MSAFSIINSGLMAETLSYASRRHGLSCIAQPVVVRGGAGRFHPDLQLLAVDRLHLFFIEEGSVAGQDEEIEIPLAFVGLGPDEVVVPFGLLVIRIVSPGLGCGVEHLNQAGATGDRLLSLAVLVGADQLQFGGT